MLTETGRRRLQAIAQGRETGPLAPWQARAILDTEHRLAEHDRAEH